MAFVPRTSENSPTPMQNNPWWYSSGNIYYTHGYGLPNCTAYAYGRFAEVAGRFIPELGGVGIHGDAGDWWDDTTQLTKGQTPQLGACICWNPTVEGAGHVAIVEHIYDNGDIDISESAWQSFYFNYRTRLTRASNYYIPYHGGTYVFKGFIYNPNGEGGGGIPIPPGTTWHAKPHGLYSDTSQEALENALMIYSTLYRLGWSTKSCAVMVGNFHRECGLNPWLWEELISYIPTYAESLTFGDRGPGYGFPQFTPPRVYILGGSSYAGYAPNLSDRTPSVMDAQAQTLFMNDHIPNDWSHKLYNYYYDDFMAIGVDISTFYYMTADEFKVGTGYSLADLFGAYMLCYLKPADWAAARSYNEGLASAQYWYSILSQYDPNKRKRKKMPVWMMLRYF